MIPYQFVECKYSLFSFNFRYPVLLRHCPVTVYLILLLHRDQQCAWVNKECSCHLQDKTRDPGGKLELKLYHSY